MSIEAFAKDLETEIASHGRSALED
jgi:hypothetical protein